jgi:hypothetical protein
VLTASVNGTPLSTATEAHPLRLLPGKPATVAMEVRDTSASPLAVRAVDLQGRVAGLVFFSFDTSVSFDVPARGSKDLSYVLDTSTLKGEVTGLVPGSLVLLGPGDRFITSEPFVSDTKGSLVSVYGLFGLGIFVLTTLALIEVLLNLGRGRLPVNRWRRGTRFLASGLGVGGVAVFTLSALGKWLPSNGHWFTILAVAAVVGFVIGYLTPTPLVPGEEEEEEGDEAAEDGLAGGYAVPPVREAPV